MNNARDPFASGLDPRLQMVVDAVRRDPSDGAELSVEHLRRVMAMAVMADGTPEEVESVRDTVAPGRGGPVPVRCYRGVGSGARPPILVWCHGGGFVAGDLATADTLCRRLANRARAVVVSVGYRLAPEHPAPAAIDDAWDALWWAVEHADHLRADRRRLAVGGDSAGGNLAALLAVRARDEGGPVLSRQLLVYPATDLTRSSPSHAENALGIFEQGAVASFYELYLAGRDATDPAVSPAAVADLSGLAPACVVTAEYDPLRDESMEYCSRLAAAEVPVEHIHYPTMMHGFFQLGAITPHAVEAATVVCDHLRAGFRAPS